MGKAPNERATVFKELLAPIVVGLVVGIIAPVVTEVARSSMRLKAYRASPKFGCKSSEHPGSRVWTLTVSCVGPSEIESLTVVINPPKTMRVTGRALHVLAGDEQATVSEVSTVREQPALQAFRLSAFRRPQVFRYRIYFQGDKPRYPIHEVIRTDGTRVGWLTSESLLVVSGLANALFVATIAAMMLRRRR